MAFILNSLFTIGEYSFTGCIDCRIKKGIHSYIDTATITLPITARLKQANPTTESVDVAKGFKRGDAVKIQLGYNGKLKQEFVGFVSKVNFSNPAEIECEGYSYQLRTKNINHSFKIGTSISEVCGVLTKDTDITLSNKIVNSKLGSTLLVKNDTAAKVLDRIKDLYGFSVYFNEKELYVGLEQVELKATTEYDLGWNTIKENDLKYVVAEQTRAKVIAKTAQSDGGKQVYSLGDADGSVKEFIVDKNKTQQELKQIAENELQKIKFTGYEGKVTAFLVPYCEHGFGAKIVDKKYPERSGTYFVPSTEIHFGAQGARRIVELSKKIST